VKAIFHFGFNKRTIWHLRGFLRVNTRRLKKCINLWSCFSLSILLVFFIRRYTRTFFFQ